MKVLEVLLQQRASVITVFVSPLDLRGRAQRRAQCPDEGKADAKN